MALSKQKQTFVTQCTTTLISIAPPIVYHCTTRLYHCTARVYPLHHSIAPFVPLCCTSVPSVPYLCTQCIGPFFCYQNYVFCYQNYVFCYQNLVRYMGYNDILLSKLGTVGWYSGCIATKKWYTWVVHLVHLD